MLRVAIVSSLLFLNASALSAAPSEREATEEPNPFELFDRELPSCCSPLESEQEFSLPSEPKVTVPLILNHPSTPNPFRIVPSPGFRNQVIRNLPSLPSN